MRRKNDDSREARGREGMIRGAEEPRDRPYRSLPTCRSVPCFTRHTARFPVHRVNLPSLHRSARRYEGTISAVGRRSLPFTHPVQTGGPGRSPPFGAHGGRDENGERRTTRGKERTNWPSHFILRLAVPFSAPFPPRSSRPFTTPFGFRSGDE